MNYLSEFKQTQCVHGRRALWYSCGVLDPEPGAPESGCIVRVLSRVPLHLRETKLCSDPIPLRQYQYKASSFTREAESATAR